MDARTNRFALVMPDGSMLQFDDLANQAIARQLPASAEGAQQGRIFRVSVQGKLQNGKIALTSIQI